MATRGHPGIAGHRGGRSLFERVFLQKLEPTTRNPARNGAGSVAANSRRGASPRNRYIGFESELPPVSSSASRAPSDSSMRANSMLSSSQKPPATPSVMLSLAVTATWSPTASFTAVTTCRGKSARFASPPPQPSVRRFNLGLRKALSR